MLDAITRVVSGRYTDSATVKKLRSRFSRDSYVRLPGLLTDRWLTVVKREVARVETSKLRKNFVMPGYNTPRIMHTVGGKTLQAISPTLAELYDNSELQELLHNISDMPIRRCSHPSEFMVVNFLQEFGATHGWHLDDPPLALVLILEAPPSEYGGLLEYIPGWRAHCDRHGKLQDIDVGPLVDSARQMECVRTVYHAPGDAYLLKASECLHRVTLMHSSRHRRTVINMGFETVDNPRYGNTANLLYT